MRAAPFYLWFAALLLGLSLSGCTRDDPAKAGRGAASKKAPRPVPPDRLRPGEVAAGDARVWGFTVPRGMRIEGQFSNAAHLGGQGSFDALIQYVGERVTAGPVELTEDRAIFPRVKILEGPADRIYKFEVSRRGLRTRILIRDITPPPTAQGLTEAERWNRVGLTAAGEPLNQKQLQ